MLPGDQPAVLAELDLAADVPQPRQPLDPPRPLLLPPGVPQLAHHEQEAGEGGGSEEDPHW